MVGTPIGNLSDASPRMRSTLAEASVIAAEDTRTLAKLVAGLGIDHTARVISVHDHNEAKRAAEVVAAIAAGQHVALVTDAGMPAVSDPGYRVVAACVAAGQQVTVVPGPSAAIAALAVSGLPSHRFTFAGFLPRKAGELRRTLEPLRHDTATHIFFESPKRISTSLGIIAEVLGAERDMVICRELTKLHEEILRGTTGELAATVTQPLRGEVAVVIAGAGASGDTRTPGEVRTTRTQGETHNTRGEVHRDARMDIHVSQEHVVADMLRLIDGGMRTKAAATEVARWYGISTRHAYEAYIHADSD